ncbi:hypothetical protein LCGC14_0422700 [marine sediment metagenome]|uniref:Uncharacterized protein n=1 Tax=marine sediment metagenome TaxID=412755 RepID=A0A0F9T8D0_9ZZZZ
MRTNILVQYQGGGYDGCYWEWNYFYIDKQGTFHDIQSSGRKAVTSIENAKELFWANCSGTYIYDMSNKDDIKTFSKETHPVHVFGVLQWFNDNGNIEFFAVCLACECGIDSCDDMVIEDKDLFCVECYSSGGCPCCESYVGDTEIVEVNPDEHYDFSYICSDCKEYHDGEREDESFEDLRWQSFCTGTPDMFSDELRALWVIV